MISKRKVGKVIGGTGKFLLLSTYILAVLAPIYWMLVTSLKTEAEIVDVNNITFWPKNITFGNYPKLFNQLKFGIYLKNSIFLSVSAALIVLIFSILAGYAMARYKFKGKTSILFFFLITQMIPGVLVTIPLYMMYSKVGLINTHLGLLILYVIFNCPFCVITMKSFFDHIPVSLEEAAYIDGCNKVQAIIKIILPILFPGIVAVFVFAFTGVWNDLLTGVIFTSKSSMWTIPVGMKTLIGKYNVQWGALTAGGIIALFPTVVMFAFVQKYIVSGLTAGAVKG